MNFLYVFLCQKINKNSCQFIMCLSPIDTNIYSGFRPDTIVSDTFTNHDSLEAACSVAELCFTVAF